MYYNVLFITKSSACMCACVYEYIFLNIYIKRNSKKKLFR